MAEPEAGHRASSRALAVLASTAFSLLLHGSVLAAALFWVERQPGAIVSPTEAISLELTETEVLEAVTTASALDAAASLASVQSDPGETVDSAAASSRPASELRPLEPVEEIEAQEPASESAPAPQGTEAMRGDLATDEATGVEQPDRSHARDDPDKPATETKARKTPVKTAKLTEPTAEREKESPSKKKGAAPSRANKGTPGSSGRVSASAGSAINYAALVRARVAARKPSGNGRRGTVVIAFGVSRSGGMSFASVARSSGDSGLDRSVLAAVRGAGPFPTPPPGASLRFAIPFYFR